jgi:hypothetical protein
LFARLIEGEWQPFSLADLVEENGGPANFSAPQPFSTEAAANHGMAVIANGDRPDDTITRRTVYAGLADVDGVPTRQWAQEPIDLAEAKEALRARVNAVRNRLQDGTVQTPFGNFDTDERSRGFLHGGVTEALIRQAAGDTTPLTFTNADGNDVSLTPAQMIGVGRMVLGYVSAVHFHARTLKDAITDATNVAAIERLDLEAGWP